MVDLFVWGAWSQSQIPAEATYVISKEPANLPSFNPQILDWFDLRPPQWGSNFNPFRTAADLKNIENILKALDTSPYWGISVPVCQEYTREFMSQYTDVDGSWFNETIRSYASYKAKEAPSATVDEWNDEMFLRLIRGETEYMHSKGLKCGGVNSIDSFVKGFRGREFSGINKFFGARAWAYMLANLDFHFCYAYSQNQTDFNTNVKPALQTLTAMLAAAPIYKHKFWILTRTAFGWTGNIKDGYALEMPLALDYGFAVGTYFGENWTDVLSVLSMYVPNPQTYSLQVNLASGGTTSLLPGTYDEPKGSIVQITAIPAAGYMFAGWLLDGATDARNPMSVTMNSNHVLTPQFTTTQQYILDVWAVSGGTTTPTGRNSYPSGTPVQIAATPAQDYVFGGWLVNNAPRSENPLTLTMTENLTVMPIFNLEPVTPEPPPSQNNTIAAGAAIATVVAAVLFAVTR